MGGGKTQSTQPTRYAGIQVQSSVAGRPIALGWGTFRVSANLLWYGAFKSVAQKTKQSGKGGGSSSTTSYTYSASVVLGICAGPIAGIGQVFKDQSALTGVGGAGLSLFTGALGQAAWGYLTASFPAQAIGYSGITYAAASDYALSSSATLPNHSFEVISTTTVSGVPDANPKDIATSFLSAVPYWQSSWLADLTDYGNYCLAANLLLSPVIDTQRTAKDFLTEILAASNSDGVWSDGKLKIVPYGDTAMTGNGVTWTPNLTPVYALDETVLTPTSEGGDPVLVSIGKDDDAWNYIQVEYLDRSNQYNAQVVPGVDQASVDQWGKRVSTSPYSLHSICDATVAATIAQLIVQRTSNIRRTFAFALPWNYCLLDPMDLVTLTSGDLNQVLVRITAIDETDDGLLQFTAEEMLVGSGHAPLITRQAPAGYVGNYAIDPGGVNAPIIVNPPRALTGGALQAWIGVSGGVNWGGAEVWVSYDGSTYSPVGLIDAPARYGVTTAAFAAGADPDTTNTLSVNLSLSGGSLSSTTSSAADNKATLCLVGSEVIAYSTATLTSANHYSLSGYIRRGQSGTSPAALASGAPFLRLDAAVFAFDYAEAQIGKTVYVKFRSFNRFGQGYQDLSVCTAYTFALAPSTASFSVIDWTSGQNVLFNPSWTSGVTNGWATVIGTVSRLIDQGGSYLHCVSTSSGLTGHLAGGFPATPGSKLAIAGDLRGPVTSGGAFVDIQWMNGGNGALIGFSSGASNPIYMATAQTDWTRYGGAITVPATTDGSATAVGLARVVFFTAGQECRNLMIEPGTVNSRYVDNATAGALVNTDATGRLFSADGLPLNTQAGKAAVISPQYPLSAPAVGQIAVAATTVTLTARTYSLPAATLTGLANDTTYAVFYDLQTSSYVAVGSGAAAYQASAARYISLGDPQRTQPAGGGTPASPPSAPPGGGGGFGGGWATP